MIYKGNIHDLMKAVEHIKIDYEISNTDISNSMGKSKQTVSNLINGQTPNITLNTLISLCDALNCDLHIDIVPRERKTEE